MLVGFRKAEGYTGQEIAKTWHMRKKEFFWRNLSMSWKYAEIYRMGWTEFSARETVCTKRNILLA